MAKLVIFDLDGTLLDTVPDLADSINTAIAKFGYPPFSYKEIAQKVGNGALTFVKRCTGLSDGEKLNEVLKEYNRVYNLSGSKKTALFEGIGETLIKLKKDGYKLAILSNKPQNSTDIVYEKYLKDFAFDYVFGGRDNIALKPSPESTFFVMNELGAQKEDTFFVGDGETDVETAKNAGVTGISVLWGYRSKEQLKGAGATLFAENPLNLYEIIKR